MPAQGYDIITIGGGIAASALAKAMAEQGAKVLVLEREVKFKDRVRGEGLVCWGGGEARELGIYELLKKSCGHDVPFVESGMGLRDLTSTTPQRLPLLSFPHQVMQETLLAAAEQAGAEVRRGVTVEQIETGKTPAVITEEGTANVSRRVWLLPPMAAGQLHENGLASQFRNNRIPTIWPECF